MSNVCKSFVEDCFTLRKKIEEAKTEYQERYGELDWKWTDEGLPYTIQDYHGSKGSVMDFTEDDWRVCNENGYNIEEICHLCDELKFIDDVESPSEYLDILMGDWKDSYDNHSGDPEIKGENIPQDMIEYFVANFYKWHTKLLPAAKLVYII